MKRGKRTNQYSIKYINSALENGRLPVRTLSIVHVIILLLSNVEKRKKIGYKALSKVSALDLFMHYS